MSPGMLTSRQHGGFGFGFRQQVGNYGQRFGGFVASPVYGAQPTHMHGKFYVDDAGRGHLEPGGRVVLEVDDEGGVSIALEPPKNGNGNGEEQAKRRRGVFGRQRMAVSSSSDGSVTIRPEVDNTLQDVGDPLSGALTVVEVEPAMLDVHDGAQRRALTAERREEAGWRLSQSGRRSASAGTPPSSHVRK